MIEIIFFFQSVDIIGPAEEKLTRKSLRLSGGEKKKKKKKNFLHPVIGRSHVTIRYDDKLFTKDVLMRFLRYIINSFMIFIYRLSI